MRLLRVLSAAGLAGGTVKHRSENGGPGALNHSRRIGNAEIFQKSPQTAGGNIPRYKPSFPNKDHRPRFNL